MFLRFLLFAILGMTAINLPAQADMPKTVPIIEIVKPYAYATSPVQKNGAIFLELYNKGQQDLRLIKAESNIAARVELHTHTMDEGMMMMREVNGYDIPAHGHTVLEPMGHHIMVMGLHQILKEGSHFPLTLHFDIGAPITVDVQIIKAGTKPIGTTPSDKPVAKAHP